jgi:SPP1 family predicted phage head-tail adaptor
VILNGKVFNPAEMRTRVILAPRTVSVETGGAQRPAPDTEHQVTVWAKWVNAHGSEVWAAASAGIEGSATVTIRYREDLDATWYISKDNGSTWWEIVSPDDIGERHEYIELKVKRMEAA